MPKYRCPKWFGATGWSSDVRIFISGNAATTVLAACGVQKRFDKIIEDSLTPCSFKTLTAWNDLRLIKSESFKIQSG